MDDIMYIIKEFDNLKEQNNLNTTTAHKLKNLLGLDWLKTEKLIEIYNYSENLFYKFLDYLINFDNKYYYSKLINRKNIYDEIFIKINECEDLSKIDGLLDKFLRKAIIYSETMYIDKNKYPKEFVEKNKDLFLIDIDIPEEVKERYLNRKLTDIDIVNYVEKLEFVPIELFTFFDLHNSNYLKKLSSSYGEGNLQKLIKKHKDVFQRFVYEHPEGLLEIIPAPHEITLDYETKFENSIKRYCRKFIFPYCIKNNKHYLPKALDSMNFELIERYEDIEELKTYSHKTLLIDEKQYNAIEYLELENIIKLDENTKYFSNNKEDKLRNLDLLGKFIEAYSFYPEEQQLLDYNEFEKYFAECLNEMREKRYFENNPDYNFIKGEFRKKYSYLFIDENAPKELYDAFFSNMISFESLQGHFEYIPYLLDKKLNEIILDNPDILHSNERMKNLTTTLIDFYVKNFGNEGLLNLICKYGILMNGLQYKVLYDDKTNEEIDNDIIKYIYDNIVSKDIINHEFLKEEKNKTTDFVAKYPDIFIDYESIPKLDVDPEKDKALKDNFYFKFYNKNIRFQDIYNYPQLIELFKDKNIKIIFGYYFGNNVKNFIVTRSFILRTDQNTLFELCVNYGKYLEYLDRQCLETVIQFETLEDKKRTIENFLSKQLIEGKICYNPTDCPNFSKEKHPELFLDEDAPERLRLLYYNYNKGDNLTFEKIAKNKDWLKYLKNKSAVTSFLRNFEQNTFQYDQTKLYFELFGQDKGLKLGITKPTTIEKMIKAEQVDKVKIWYERTGEKFIPDYVVMQNFPIDQIDKFLKSSSIWSKLMKIERYSNNEEGRDALLKLAYVFGVFDNDQKGINQLYNLINGLPKTMNNKLNQVIDWMDKGYRAYKNKNDSLKLYRKNHYNILQTLKEEGFEIDVEKGVMSSIYSSKDKESDKLYLNIDQQKYPKSSLLIREEIEKYEYISLLNFQKAHLLFGGFKLIYDKDFKDFLIENLDEILTNSDYGNRIGNIQRQFRDIKIANSNRKLTLDLAISYIQQNKYTDIEVGNEEVAEISSIAGYSQSDFDTLQLIYNYGKQRVFSSIPRIKNQQDKYNYEILRLDDPLALAIGTLTDCCQEIGNVAEMCVEHSMVDKNGRVFVIKDNIGNIISQSWVWRNKNVLCFDNIEIPDKAFTRISNTKEFTTEVYNIYKKAAQELIMLDEQKYKELLEEGKITQEQYEGLKLSKVTVGLGYNDIAETIKEKSTKDKNTTSPLETSFPVKLDHSLYTNDSNTQYILEKTTTSTPYNGNTLSLYNDELKIYTKENFKEKELLKLKKLEIETKGFAYDLVTDLYDETENIMSELADNCELDEEKIKVIMTPNYAIIYEEDEDTIKIGEILYNIEVNSQTKTINIKEKVLLQLKLALEEITKDKKVDIELLDDNQKKFYLKAMKINEQLDIERGIKDARKNK